MPNCKRVTRSGAVYEVEFYPVSETVRDFSNSKPEPVNVRTPEEKERYNNHKSEKHFIRLVNTNFTSAAYYITLTYDNEHLPSSYAEAVKNLDNYIRRLRYSNPHAKIVAVTGYGSRSGRLHHHLIVSGVSEGDLLGKWLLGDIAKVEHLRKDNYYNGVNHGEDFTALAIYLHQHTPTEHKGKRWKQTKNIQQPEQKKAKQVKRVYSSERPPKAPKGFMFVEARTSDYYKSGYVYFKYVREVQEPLNIQPNFSKRKQFSECQRL